jgi:hypothetical protein
VSATAIDADGLRRAGDFILVLASLAARREEVLWF